VAWGGGLRDRLRRRPVQLIEIDPIDAEPSQAAPAFGGDVSRRGRTRRRLAVHTESELREDERSPRRRQLLHRTADDIFRVTPIAPYVSADRPADEADRGDLESAAKLSSLHAHS
jgi:hypothetical protein